MQGLHSGLPDPLERVANPGSMNGLELASMALDTRFPAGMTSLRITAGIARGGGERENIALHYSYLDAQLITQPTHCLDGLIDCARLHELFA